MQFAVTEYTSLRAEIVQLTTLQSQIIWLTLVAFGAVLPVANPLQNSHERPPPGKQACRSFPMIAYLEDT
ncbi:hypothetical protein [Sphaerisporangium sp. TRM90804]|uniref:hypothetical protein n=1 Tax=Sphaerisporangium sp. TRM90804 TaxID=3031113 RepID=UPI002446A2E5|nr:hypothetical protein [Sphaerisporangium sp. TRM90804]MDH2428431.1 hypothetical protein [Sphaerisporangium sp. TRM90804]